MSSGRWTTTASRSSIATASELGDWFQRYGFVTNPAWKSATATPGVPQRLTLPNVISSVHSPYGRIDTAYTAISPATGLGTTVAPNFSYRNYVFTDDGKGVRPFVSGAITSGSAAPIDVRRTGVRRR